jgi:periplasmic divalent cation tolerance protein
MSDLAEDYQICITTVNSLENAKIIAKKILEEKLVACVNITQPVLSMYHWDNKIVEEQEYILMMKTLSVKIGALKHLLVEIHPYETPEFVCLTINDATEDYLNWIRTSIQDSI